MLQRRHGVSSPPMMGRRHGLQMPVHYGPVIQRGHGIGSWISNLVRKAIPALSRLFSTTKQVGKAVANSEAGQRLARKAGEAGLATARAVLTDTLAGDNIGVSLKERGAQLGKQLGKDAVQEGVDFIKTLEDKQRKSSPPTTNPKQRQQQAAGKRKKRLLAVAASSDHKKRKRKKTVGATTRTTTTTTDNDIFGEQES